MADTVGRIEILVDANGDRLPEQVRRAGRKAGREAGDEFGKEFEHGADEGGKKASSRLEDRMGSGGERTAKKFADGFSKQLQNGNLQKSIEKTANLRELGFKVDDTGQFAQQVNTLAQEFDALGKRRLADAKASDQQAAASERASAAAERATQKMLRGNQAQVLRQVATSMRLQARARREDEAAATRQAAAEERLARANNSEAIRRVTNSMRLQARARRDDAKATAEQEKESRRLGAELDKLETRFARIFNQPNGLENYSRTFISTERAAESLRGDLDKLGRAGRLSADEFQHFRSRITETTREVGRSERVMNTFGRGLNRIGVGLRGLTVQLPQLSHGFKQAIFYTLLFTSLAPGIATLGSIAGSGIVALAVGVAALGLGVAALIPGFKGMLGDVDKLPPKARAAASAMQAFKQPLKDMQRIIQEGLFDGLADDIDSLRTKTLPVITKGMSATAVTLNGIFTDMIGRLTSSRGLGKIDTLMSGLQPILKSLGGTALNLGGILGSLFNAGLKNGQGFASFLDDVTGKFNAFLNTDEGRDMLADWFHNLEVLAPRVGNLIASAGKAVSDLVTDKAVTNMADFLDVMTTALPNVVGSLGGLIDAFDPLGLAAVAVREIGDWFSKNAGGMAAFGKAANDFAKSAGGTIGTLLGDLGEAILKVAPQTVESLSKSFDSLTKALDKPEVQQSIEDLANVLPDVAEAISSLVTALADSGAIGTGIKAIGNAAEIASPALKVLSGVLKALTGDLPGAGKAFGDAGKKMKDLAKNFDLFPGGGKGADKAARDRISKGGAGGFFQSMWDGLIGGLDSDANQRTVDGLKGKLDKQAKDGGAKLGGSFGDSAKEGIKSGTDKKAPEIATVFSGFSAKILEGARTAFDKDSGVGNILGGFIEKLFGGDTAGEGKAKAKGGAIADALLLGLKSVVEKIPVVGPLIGSAIDSMLGGDDKKTSAAGKGKDIGGAYAGGVAGGVDAGKGQVDTSAGNLSGSFLPVPGLIGGFLSSIPGTIGGIFGQVTGQPGADNAVTPFAPVPGRIGGLVNPIIGAIKGIMGLVTGQAGADNTATPFAPVPGRVRAFVNGVPQEVNSGLAGVTGQPAADRVTTPFSPVAGKIGGHVSGVSGQVSSRMSGINDFGAADRIVAAFRSVPSLVSAALGGLGGVVSRALAGAQAALSVGVNAIVNAVPHASGGITNGPEIGLIGEAGREAIIPLDRPLSQVDPSVRGLAAYAQGKVAAPERRPTKVVNWQPGSVVYTSPNSDPELVIEGFLDSITEDI